MPTQTQAATFTWLAREAMRLIREMPWKSTDDLAQEIAAIFQGKMPFEIQGPLVIRGDGINPFIIFNGWKPGQVGDLTFQLDDGTTGKLKFEEPNAEDEVTTKGTTGGSGGGNVTIGEILSGSGASYIVKTYPNGLAGATINRNVTQLQIDSAEVIPAGTWALIVNVGGNYFMQVSVWL